MIQKNAVPSNSITVACFDPQISPAIPGRQDVTNAMHGVTLRNGIFRAESGKTSPPVPLKW